MFIQDETGIGLSAGAAVSAANATAIPSPTAATCKHRTGEYVEQPGSHVSPMNFRIAGTAVSGMLSRHTASIHGARHVVPARHGCL